MYTMCMRWYLLNVPAAFVLVDRKSGNRRPVHLGPSSVLPLEQSRARTLDDTAPTREAIGAGSNDASFEQPAARARALSYIPTSCV